MRGWFLVLGLGLCVGVTAGGHAPAAARQGGSMIPVRTAIPMTHSRAHAPVVIGGVGVIGEPAPLPLAAFGQQLPAPAAPVRSAADERPTIEQTVEGVTVVRGPGSHVSR
jgi:hypothetical protein